MGESTTSHPYRSAPPGASPRPRRVPWIVRVNVMFGDSRSLVALLVFDILSAVWWFVPTPYPLDSTGARILMVMLPSVFATLMVVLICRRLATVRLLRSGVVGYATLRDRVQIQSRLADYRPAMDRLHFTFEHCGWTYHVKTDATDDEARRIVDDPREQIVFRPGEKLRVELIDALPGRPRIREDNTIDPRNHVLGAVTALVLLAAAVAINAAGALPWLR